jgi:hypothetical protein
MLNRHTKSLAFYMVLTLNASFALAQKELNYRESL